MLWISSLCKLPQVLIDKSFHSLYLLSLICKNVTASIITERKTIQIVSSLHYIMAGLVNQVSQDVLHVSDLVISNQLLIMSWQSFPDVSPHECFEADSVDHGFVIVNYWLQQSPVVFPSYFMVHVSLRFLENHWQGGVGISGGSQCILVSIFDILLWPISGSVLLYIRLHDLHHQVII